MIKKLFSLLNMLFPKSNIILFNSFPFYSDNAKALYEYIINNRNDIINDYRIYWMVDNNNIGLKSSGDGSFKTVKKKSVKGVILFLRAKYIFATHGYFKEVKSPDRQYNVNLWHGCGYKGNSIQEQGYRGNYNIVTNDIYKPIHSVLFNISEENIVVTGLPRNDRLFDQRDAFAKLGIESSRYKKVLIWMPTYRVAEIGHDDVDGDLESFGVREFLSSADKFSELLEKENYLLIIKPHPLEEKFLPSMAKESNAVFVLYNDFLAEKNITIYDVLKETNVLISDYSSVIVDYLLTEGDIAILAGDYESYSDNRGFVFEDIESVLPGPILRSEEQFYDYIKNLDLINKQYRTKRNKIKDDMHRYSDGNSCKRVADYFFGEKRND